MKSEAVFENIGSRIQQEIGNAQNTLHIAVAWFTNKNIFNAILEKAKSGIKVFLIVSDDIINSNSKIIYNEIEKYGGQFYRIGNSETELMHNKFCIIDSQIVITGSYNWSYKAENNIENIIINEDGVLAKQFIDEFNNIVNKFIGKLSGEKQSIPLDFIRKRFQIIKNYIELEEYIELKREVHKLSEYKNEESISKIYYAALNNDFIKVIDEIENFFKKYDSITIYEDPEIFTLKLEVRILENKLNAFNNEKVEIEKVIADFHHSYSNEIGNIILEILKLRKLKYANDKNRLKEVEDDFNDFKEDFESQKNKTVFELSENEKLELKKKFRKATFLCHPDKVSDDLKDLANNMFIELKKANDENNLKKVNDILTELEKGNFFKPKSETISEKNKLKAYFSKLKMEVEQIEQEILELFNSETYQLIISIQNWSDYFTELKSKLENELKDLKSEVKQYI